MTKEQFEKFLTLTMALSPENLTCDGELPRAEVKRRHKKLTTEWQKLEKEVGRPVTDGEIWQRHISESR